MAHFLVSLFCIHLPKISCYSGGWKYHHLFNINHFLNHIHPVKEYRMTATKNGFFFTIVQLIRHSQRYDLLLLVSTARRRQFFELVLKVKANIYTADYILQNIHRRAYTTENVVRTTLWFDSPLIWQPFLSVFKTKFQNKYELLLKKYKYRKVKECHDTFKKLMTH